MESKELAAWLTLSLMPGMYSRLYNHLLQSFETPTRVLTTPLTDPAAKELPPRLRAALTSMQARRHTADLELRLEQALHWAADPDQAIVTRAHPQYPGLLREIPDPPPLLYVKGDLRRLSLPQIAVVGSRRPTPGGRKSARRLATELSAAGFSVCSGMALGIDAESHEGALDSGGATIAVLGCGLDRIYPPRNRQLAKRIAGQGALISEFPLGTALLAAHFPQRNRIISGLSQGTVVVEAGLRSGSLITARHALEQGREVFAVPGSIHSAVSRGCHWLLKNGAKLVEDSGDILEDLGVWPADTGERDDGMASKRAELGSRAKRLIAEIDHDVTTVDALVDRTGFATRDVQALLTELELLGLIQPHGGGFTLSV